MKQPEFGHRRFILEILVLNMFWICSPWKNPDNKVILIYKLSEPDSAHPRSITMKIRQTAFPFLFILIISSVLILSCETESPAALEVIETPEITGVTVPVAGETPNTTLTETDEYTGTVSWDPDDDAFASGTVYTATITLSAKTGYTFAGVTEDFFTVEGASSVSNAADSGIVTAVFPEATYKVGGTGPSGGYVFYDDEIGYDVDDGGTIEANEKNLLGDGLRFLEAAPADVVLDGSDNTHIFGYYRTAPDGDSTLLTTATGVGSGKTNTDALVTAMGMTAYTSSASTNPTTTENYAARLCDIHEAGGYDDWFLPSKDELNLMRQNLYQNDLGGFDGSYWSSSEITAISAWNQSFYWETQGEYYRNTTDRVRPVRAF